MSRTKTVIFGGSFDPIHVGHLSLASAVCESGLASEVWFMVSPQNPHKQGCCMTDENVRLHMVRLATEGNPAFKASDFEFSLPRPSYTINTLNALEQAYPDREFVLLIGADNWERFHRWYRSDDILSAYRLIVYPRPGYTCCNVPPNVTVVDTPLLDISSTEIRRRIASEPDYNGEGLPPVVWEEIKDKNLYR